MAHGESARCIRAGLRHGRLHAYAMPGKDIGPPFGSAEAVNGLRSPCGLARTAWTDPVLIAGVTPVKTVHLTERAGRVPTTGSRIRRPRTQPPDDMSRWGGTVRCVRAARSRRRPEHENFQLPALVPAGRAPPGS